MKPMTCVVVGAGFAGIHAVKEIRKTFKEQMGSYQLRLVLIDKNPYHLRKVLLFRPAVTNEDIKVPLTKLFPEGVEMVQATVTRIEAGKKTLLYQDAAGAEHELNYDALVVAAGSIIRKPDAEQGGIALSSLDNALTIRNAWLDNMRRAVTERDQNERERLMSIAVAGAGISGMETASELAYYARLDAEKLGLDPQDVKIHLYNAHKRLFLNGPAKVAMKLEHFLQEVGINVRHEIRVLQENDGLLTLSNGDKQPIGLCIWTLGLKPNPMLQALGLPVNPDGYVVIDASYRVQSMEGVYSIGDCAHVVDPDSGQADGMTCKEAIPQAARLSMVLLADLQGHSAPAHSSFMNSFSIGLGPDRGLTWVHKWGVDFVVTGKLAWRIKKFTWDTASLLR